MPAAAFGLVALFAVIAFLAGAVAAWLIGPRRRSAVRLPAAAAFVALWGAGHGLGLEIGPTVELLGFRVALLGDILIAVVAAAIAARLQCLVLTRMGR
ncbi:MAG: hypothetical protein ACKOTZ_02420 [Chloroflexota bacterium]